MPIIEIPPESNYQPAPQPAKWFPKPESVAELEHMRHSELLTVSQRLGRVDQREPGGWWRTAGEVLVGVVAGGVLGAVPQFSADDPVDWWYWAAVGVLAVLSVLCFVAARDVQKARAETIGDIKEDLDTMLDRYGPWSSS